MFRNTVQHSFWENHILTFFLYYIIIFIYTRIYECSKLSIMEVCNFNNKHEQFNSN